MIPTITFGPDAGDSFVIVTETLAGWWVEVTTVGGARVDGRLVDPSNMPLTGYDEVVVQPVIAGTVREETLVLQAKEIRVI